MNILIVLGKTLLFYVIIMLSYRFMGKREVGELSVIDLIISIFIAELAAISIDNVKDNIFLSILPIFLLVVIQIVLSKISLKSESIRKKIDGDVSIIINRGKINFEEMLKQRYNLDDLLTQLREKSIKSIEEVDYAVLESSGKLSVFKREDDQERLYPLPVILDGKIEEDTMRQINKKKSWLLDKLNDKNIKLEDVFYAFYKKDELFIINRNSIK